MAIIYENGVRVSKKSDGNVGYSPEDGPRRQGAAHAAPKPPKAPKPERARRVTPHRAWQAAKVGGVALALIGAADIAHDFGFKFDPFGIFGGAYTQEGGQSSIDLASLKAKYAPLDCDTTVTGLAPTKAKGDYHPPRIISWIFPHDASGSAIVNKDIPLEWGECNNANQGKTPVFIGHVINGKNVAVLAPIPAPSRYDVGVADLNMDICLNLPAGASQATVKAERAQYIADAKAHKHDVCNPNTSDSGLGINEGTSATTIEFSRQLADMGGYLQPMPRGIESSIMHNAQRAMIAQEHRYYPGSYVKAPLEPTQTPYQQTVQGMHDLMTETDTAYMFHDMHLTSSHGETTLHLASGNNVSGTVEMQNDALSHSQVVYLNSQIPSYARAA